MPTQSLPAQLKHNSRGYYVEYFVLDPTTGKNTRVRENLNKLQKRLSPAEFKKQAAVYIANINVKLFAGWSPFVAPTVSACGYTSITDALQIYQEKKLPDYEKSTRTCYESLIRIFLRHLQKQGADKCYACSITHQVALSFMDERGRTLSNNGYNSDLKKYRSIFTWLQERRYVETNPFAGIRPKKKQEKFRQTITDDVRETVKEYCRENMPGFLLVVHLIYNSLIRPKEIVFLQLKHVHLDEHYILVPAEIAKTDKERMAPLTDQEVAFLRSWHIEQYPGEYYLIGGDYKPDKKHTYIGKYKKTWEAMRKRLGIPEDQQLYSWKDTGISDMFDAGLDALTVQHAADHSDLSTTSRYARQASRDMIRKVAAAGLEL